MKFYADRPLTALRQIITDLAALVWVVLWVRLALRLYDLVEGLATPGRKLSDAGTRLALRVIRRHRLLELFLVKTLGLAWDEVHEEAEHLEHAVSERLIDRIDGYLGHPDHDPHGDPIPRPTARSATSTASR